MANPVPITINDLLTSYGNIVPVSTSAGVSSAIDWINIVEVYCLEHIDAVPNGHYIVFYCEDANKNIKLLDTDYAKINNYMYHIRSMLYAITQQLQ